MLSTSGRPGWDRLCQQLGVTVGELLPDQPVPLLKKRLELSRKEALKLWSEKHKEEGGRRKIGNGRRSTLTQRETGIPMNSALRPNSV